MPSAKHKGRPRDPTVDRKIVDACVALLGEVGRARLTREQIARRAGVSLPAVNRRYESVDAILRAVASTPMHADALPEAPDLRSHLIAMLRRDASRLDRRARRPAAG